jgi:tRNA nucleotidyltransferase (CCA-adding enzyme)
VLEALTRCRAAAASIDSGAVKPENAPGVYRALQGLTLEALLFMIADTGAAARRKTVSRYLVELRNVRPTLDGEDLKALGIRPGPVFSEIFERLLDARLRGEVASRGDEEEFVKKNFGGR